MAEAVFLVDIDAPLDGIRNALTTEDGIVGWWTTDAAVPDGVGDVMLLGFPDAPERFNLRVDSVEGDRVRWTSVGSFPPHWTGTEISWTIMDNPDSSGSRLFFEHTGFGAADPMLGHTAFTWANLMNSLKSYCETGEGAAMFNSQT